jgi:diguanylate cyclase (GGDEF)-like protein
MSDLLDGYLIPKNVNSLIDATVRRAGAVSGVLCCEREQAVGRCSEAQIELEVGLADLAGQLILIADLRRREKLQRLLLSMGPELGEDHTELEPAELALVKMAELFPDTWSAFYVPDTDPDYLCMLANRSLGSSIAFVESRRRVPVSHSVIGQAMRERRIVSARGEVFQNLYAKVDSNPMIASIGVPLFHDHKFIGAMVIGLLRDDAVTEDDLSSLDIASTTFAVAFANARNAEQLRHRALHDAMTGLPNRDKLHQDIEVHTQAPMMAKAMSLMLVGTKDFKQVNDTLGRGNGDRLLKITAERVAAFAKRIRGVAYRLAGDEFAVLMDRCETPVVAAELALQLQTIVSEPFEVAGLSLILRSRVGSANLPEHGRNGHELLRSADVALGWAGVDLSGISFYDMARDASGPRSLEVMADLRQAIKSDALDLHLQPKVSLVDGRLVGCEALLRWIHPQHGYIPPTNFIAVAEKGELMDQLTLWVARRALRHARELRCSGVNIPIAINVSGHNMVDADFPSELQALVADSGLESDAIHLEITETVLMSDPERAATVIGELAAIGFALDIDDFGTGYSSLSYLRRPPLKSLKIDRAFVMELNANAQDVHIVRSTVGLAHGLGLSVIAEVVEDAHTLELLGKLGCDMAQGFGIGKPMPVDEFLQWALKHSAT